MSVRARLEARCIGLRRPPVLVFAEGPFVPERADLEQVEARWQALRRKNSAYFDGRVCHVRSVQRNGCGGATLHVVDCAYRFHAVQDERVDLGVRALGVKGMTIRSGRVLAGRRSQHVAGAPGLWEFAPGGGVEPQRPPQEVVADELLEETGLRAAREPLAVALLLDPSQRTWEIAYRIDSAQGEPRARQEEYTELRWCTMADLPQPLSPIARQMVPLVQSALNPGRPSAV